MRLEVVSSGGAGRIGSKRLDPGAPTTPRPAIAGRPEEACRKGHTPPSPSIRNVALKRDRSDARGRRGEVEMTGPSRSKTRPPPTTTNRRIFLGVLAAALLASIGLAALASLTNNCGTSRRRARHDRAGYRAVRVGRGRHHGRGPEWLANFTRQLVDDHLVACGHNIAPIRAIYRWEGKVYDETQARVGLHTRASLVPEIVTCADRDHPDDVPCVIAQPIRSGHPSYLQWVYSETVGLS